MRFYVLTLFPEMIKGGLGHSIIKRGEDNGIIEVIPIDIRDFSKDKHRHVDDYPYGGGAGMVMQPQPIYDAYCSIKDKLASNTPVLYMSPQGRVYDQKMAEELAKLDDLVILCGHYEGVDERVIEEIVTEEVSVGDFVLTGGELPAMAVIDSVARLIDGVLNKEESHIDETFSKGLLEYPQYTRPPVFNGKGIPEVLLSGHHGKVAEWRHEKSLERTLKKRPDLLETAELTQKDIDYINKLKDQF